MVVICEYEMTPMHDNEMNTHVTRDLDIQDDTIIYVMHGALNHQKSLYINNRNSVNNLD